jgi:uncharacterized protein
MSEPGNSSRKTPTMPLREIAAGPGKPTGSFRQFVLKIAGRCNLDCDYCYIYHGQDQGWRTRPRFMGPATIRAVANRISQHVRAHDLATAQVVLHGGEPLLAGPAAIESALTMLRTAMPQGTRMRFTVQTNGSLLTQEFVEVFARNQVSVGISLDGTAASQDRHRRRLDSRGSYSDVVRGLRLLSAQPGHGLLAGLLCTIDLANDPIATYEALADFAPPSVDFLLPLATWAQPPPRRSPEPVVQSRVIAASQGRTSTPYADWLLTIFDHWYGSSTQISVRLFDEIINLLLGGQPTTEVVGGAPLAFAVIETDGTIESADTLKFAHPTAAATGMSVFTNSFDDVLGHPAVAAQRLGIRGLCDTCRSCPVVEVCGGGHYAHRYQPGNGFDNPSVYCADLLRVIEHIGRRLLADFSVIRSRKP